MSRPRFKPGLPTIPEEEVLVIPGIFDHGHEAGLRASGDCFYEDDDEPVAWLETITLVDSRQSSQQIEDNCNLYEEYDDVVITDELENVKLSELNRVNSYLALSDEEEFSEEDVLLSDPSEEESEVSRETEDSADQGSTSFLQLMSYVADWFLNAMRSLFSCLFPCCFFAPAPASAEVTEKNHLLVQ